MHLRAVLQLSASLDGASSCWFLLFAHPSYQSNHLACQNASTDSDDVGLHRTLPLYKVVIALEKKRTIAYLLSR